MRVSLIPWLAAFIVHLCHRRLYCHFLLPPRLPRDDGREKPWAGEVCKTFLGGRSVRNDWKARFAAQEQAVKYTKRAARYVDRIPPTRCRTEDEWEDRESGIDWCVYYAGPKTAQLPEAA